MQHLPPVPEPRLRCGLYAVTDAQLTREQGLIRSVERALRAGATLVQYRDKESTTTVRREQAQALLELCRRFRVPFVVNDDVLLAQAIGADGVHVGRDDEAVARARATLGAQAIVGASCYHELALARQAVEDGASYVAFGRFFTSQTKPGQALATLELLAEARRQLDVPIAAIGGITAANGADLVAAGASLLAVINDLWCEPDCTARAAALVACFDQD